MPKVQYFDFDSLTIFKELLIRNYQTHDAGRTYASQRVAAALQQYRKDIIKFSSTKRNLPLVGEPGTIYFVHHARNLADYTPHSREIWIDAPEFGTMRARFVASTTATYYPLEKNDFGYFVLNLDDKDIRAVSSVSGFSLLESNETSTSGSSSMTTGMGCTQPYLYYSIISDTEPGSITASVNGNMTQSLGWFAGKIITVYKGTNTGFRRPLIQYIPQAISGSDVANTTLTNDEIWITVNGDYWRSVCVAFGDTSYDSTHQALTLQKNALGYYVLPVSEIPSTDTRVWFFDGDNYTSTYFSAENRYCTRSLFAVKTVGSSAALLKSSELASLLGGKIISVAADNSLVSISPVSSMYTGENGEEFLMFVYENGKYIALGNTIFNVADYVVDNRLAFTDNTVENQVIANAVKDKYNAADIVTVVDPESNNIITSDAVYNALLPKADWKTCIPISLLDIMEVVRNPEDMPKKLYFKLELYAPLHEQDLAIFYPNVTQYLSFTTYGSDSFIYDYGLSTQKSIGWSSGSYDNDYGYSYSQFKDPATNEYFNIYAYAYASDETRSDTCMGYARYLIYQGNTSNTYTGKDFKVHFVSKSPVTLDTLARLTFKFKAYDSSYESTRHNHINRLYVTTYVSPDGDNWSVVQNKVLYEYTDNYNALSDYIYLIPILA